MSSSDYYVTVLSITASCALSRVISYFLSAGQSMTIGLEFKDEGLISWVVGSTQSTTYSADTLV